jgi:membrane-bound acyltransferase YfiQ involved in biofilm formation
LTNGWAELRLACLALAILLPYRSIQLLEADTIVLYIILVIQTCFLVFSERAILQNRSVGLAFAFPILLLFTSYCPAGYEGG